MSKELDAMWRALETQLCKGSLIECKRVVEREIAQAALVAVEQYIGLIQKDAKVYFMTELRRKAGV